MLNPSSKNNPISPISQTRTESSYSLYTKTSISKLPILKREYMTARNISRNPHQNLDSDFRTFEATTIKETEEDLAIKEYLSYKFRLVNLLSFILT